MAEYDKAIAQAYELRKGISNAIQVTIDSAKNLYYAIANPQEIETIETVSDKQITEAHDTVLSARTPEQRKEALFQYNKLQEMLKQGGVIQVPKVDPSAFADFMSNFYGLWLATAVHIKETHWKHPEARTEVIKGQKVEFPPTKESIEWLFREYTSQKHHPSISLQLFEDFIESLSNSGMYDLTVMEVPE